jgi:hypothetical protein
LDEAIKKLEQDITKLREAADVWRAKVSSKLVMPPFNEGKDVPFSEDEMEIMRSVVRYRNVVECCIRRLNEENLVKNQVSAYVQEVALMLYYVGAMISNRFKVLPRKRN